MFAHNARVLLVAGVLAAGSVSPNAAAQPTLKGPLEGFLIRDPAGSGAAVFVGNGRLTLMGLVDVYGEFDFEPSDDDAELGLGVMVFQAANRDRLVANVRWEIDADGNGQLEFRWPGEITLASGQTVRSTGRFVELPFGGLRGTSTLTSPSVVNPYMDYARIRMTGEIVDPDPLD
jgi:hypothetical protein